jgi:hypothetical protein
MAPRCPKGCYEVGPGFPPGGNIVSPAQWDDVRFEPDAQNLLNPAGRIDFDTTELTVDFQANALYPDDDFFGVRQMSHRYKLQSSIRPHCHFYQLGSAVPNWLVELRIYKNGGLVPAGYQLYALDQLAFTYPGSGTFFQIAFTDLIDMTATGPFGAIDTVSAFVDMKFYRDTTNVSGLFAGPDPQAGNAKLKEFDIHYQIDSSGSNQEFIK